MFVQYAADKKLVQSQGFIDVRVVGINTPFKGISITKTGGQHGSDSILLFQWLLNFWMNQCELFKSIRPKNYIFCWRYNI